MTRSEQINSLFLDQAKKRYVIWALIKLEMVEIFISSFCDVKQISHIYISFRVSGFLPVSTVA